jgi:hypothetical protein
VVRARNQAGETALHKAVSAGAAFASAQVHSHASSCES